MRFAATLTIPLTALALISCAEAQADSPWAYYSKWLSEYGVNYQGRVTNDEMIAKAQLVCSTLQNNPTKAGLAGARDAIVKQGILTQDEATKVAYSAVSAQSYCPQFQNLMPI